MEIKKKRLEEEIENREFKFFKKLDERDELEKDMENLTNRMKILKNLLLGNSLNSKKF